MPEENITIQVRPSMCNTAYLTWLSNWMAMHRREPSSSEVWEAAKAMYDPHDPNYRQGRSEEYNKGIPEKYFARG